jgi:hypothetical protein
MRKDRKARNHPLQALLKQVRHGNLHPEIGLEKRPFSVRLSASQQRGLKKLARESGTTWREEMDRAIDAYLLGLSRKEINMLHALVAELERSTVRANKALDEALRAVEKTKNVMSRKRRRR